MLKAADIKPGQLLVAHPDLNDRYFRRSVVLVTENTPNNTVGLVVNKPSLVSVAEAIEQNNDTEWPYDDTLYQGGPVNIKSLITIHTAEWHSSNTLNINDVVSISSDNFMMEKMATGNLPKNHRFVVGMCGWAPGQLQKEIDTGKGWLTCDSNESILFEYSGPHQWDLAINLCARYAINQYF